MKAAEGCSLRGDARLGFGAIPSWRAGLHHHLVLEPQRLARPSTLCEDEVLPRGPQSPINPICCCRVQVKAAEGCSLRGDARLGLGAIPFWRAGIRHHLVLGHNAWLELRLCGKMKCYRVAPSPELFRFAAAGYR